MPSRRPRRRAPWVAYLWPGLPHLWIEGSLAGLTLALAFSVLLNVLVLGVVVWPGWLETELKWGCGGGVALLWLVALWETRGELRRLAARADEAGTAATWRDPSDEPLRAAQRSYLRGDWVGAEKSLRRALGRDGRDVEAQLWYAMLLRRTGRKGRALRRLRRLERLDDAGAWNHEIQEERSRLTALGCEKTEEPTAAPVAERRIAEHPTSDCVLRRAA